MKKTVTVNIGKIVFHIDDDAYSKLKTYLDQLANHFANAEGKDEILADIEARMAEILSAKYPIDKKVVSTEDVDELIETLGNPEAFETDEEMDENPSKTAQHHSNKSRAYKKLYRDPDSAVIGGVCAGLGHYLGVSTILLRLLWLLAFLFFGSGFLLYIICWIIIPKANTSSEKLEMKGEPVNFENIGKTVEESAKKIKKNFENIGKKDSPKAKELKREMRSAVEKILDFFGKLLNFILRFFRKAIGILLIVIAIFSLGPLIAMYSAGYDGAFFMQSNDFVFQSFTPIGDLIFNDTAQAFLAKFSLLIITISPLLLMLLSGIWLLNRKFPKIKHLFLALFLLFIVGISLSIYTSLKIKSDFKYEDKVVNTIPLSNLHANDTLRIYSSSPDFDMHLDLNNFGQINVLNLNNDSITALGYSSLNIYQCKDLMNAQARVEIIRSSKGKTKLAAKERADKINYGFYIEGNKLNIDPYYSLFNHHQFRNQKVTVNIYLKEGQSIFLSDETAPLLVDVDGKESVDSELIVNRVWLMDLGGLSR